MFERDLLFRELANVNREYEVTIDCQSPEWEAIKNKFKTRSWKLESAGFRRKIYTIVEKAGQDPNKWFNNFTDEATFLGRKFNKPIHIEFATHLKIVEENLAKKYGNNDSKKAGDVLQLSNSEKLVGGRQESSTAKGGSMHTFGLAMDVNHDGNPYLGGDYTTPSFNSDEELQTFLEKLKREVRVQNLEFSIRQKVVKGKTLKYAVHKKMPLVNIIFGHMGLLLSSQKEAYPTGFNYATRLKLFDELERLSKLLVRYFNLNGAQLNQALSQAKPNSFWSGKDLSTALAQIESDWNWFCIFVGRWSSRNNVKANGFMKLDRRFVEELELDWGAAYGDIMHFDMRNKCIGQTIHQIILNKTPAIKKSSAPTSKPSSVAKTNSSGGNASADMVRANRIYGKKLGWYQYIEQINDLLLPYSGKSNVSLGEEDFAYAVMKWQEKNGFTGRNVDGVIGPGTWAVLKRSLKGVQTTSASPPPLSGGSNQKNESRVKFIRSGRGWKVYGGGRIKDKLRELQRKNPSIITNNEIEIFSILAEKESGGYVNVINSWDSAYMSMGFFQFPAKFDKLQRVIAKAPEAFRKYGIEIDGERRYSDKHKPRAIKNASRLEDLRSREWAERFYQAGLEDDVIVAQIKVAREIFYDELLQRYDPKNYLNRFKGSHPGLWAFIFEADNSRPAPFRAALRSAINEALKLNINDHRSFGQLLIRTLRSSTENYYSQDRSYEKKNVSEAEKRERIKKELAKIERIITTTGVNKN